MNTQVKLFAIVMGLAGIFLNSTSAQRADIVASSAAQEPSDQMDQLIKKRDAAAVKAFAAETKLREAGVTIDSLGFDLARSARDLELSAARDHMERHKAYELSACRLGHFYRRGARQQECCGTDAIRVRVRGRPRKAVGRLPRFRY